jgi:hypothetical protein
VEDDNGRQAHPPQLPGGLRRRGGAAPCLAATAPADGKIRVVVWDERQPEQKEAYPGFLGDWVARFLVWREGGRP